jgi:hypothetical protein
MKTPYPCYTCTDPIPETQKRIVATFEGSQRDLCENCAEGIYYGNEILGKVGVSGEAIKTERKNKL